MGKRVNVSRIKLHVPSDVKDRISLHAKRSGIRLRYFMESILDIYLNDLKLNPRSLSAATVTIISESDENRMLDVDISKNVKNRLLEYCETNNVNLPLKSILYNKLTFT